MFGCGRRPRWELLCLFVALLILPSSAGDTLFNPPPHADHVLYIEVFARLEADRLRAIDDVKRPLPPGVSRLGADLLAEHVTLGIHAVVQRAAADGLGVRVGRRGPEPCAGIF